MKTNTACGPHVCTVWMSTLLLLSTLVLATGAQAQEDTPASSGDEGPFTMAESLAAQPTSIPTEPTSLEAAVAQPETEFFTLDELRDEMRKLAWTKGEYRIVPYGVLWGSAIAASERTNAGPYVLFVQSPLTEGERDFVIDTRRTRVGLDIAGPQVPMFGGAESGAKLEIDFHGQFQTENKASVLLRHAYAEVKNDDWRLLAGQYWDLISPLNPGTMNYSVGWDGGNIGYRRMQIRLDRNLHINDCLMITPQIAACQNIVSDTATNVRSESSAWPIMQGRMGFTVGERGPGATPVTFGFSGHIGEQGFDFFTPTGGAPPTGGNRNDARVRTWSVNADLRVPLTSRLGVQGEFFSGDNLGTFLGGVGQGVNLANSQTVHGIRSTGGWVDVWYDLTSRLHSHVGYGIDDPLDSDLSAASGRIYNQFVFGNVSFDVTKKLILGLELSQWTTLYKSQLPGEATVIEFAGQYGF